MNPQREPWRARSTARPNTLFLQMVFIYVCLLTFAFTFESGVFKLLSAAFAFWVVAVLMVNAVFMSTGPGARVGQISMGFGLAASFLVYYMGMGAGALLNRGYQDVGELLKIALAPLFLGFGFIFAGRDKTAVWSAALNRMMFSLLVLLPLGLWGLQLALGRTAWGGNQLVGFFVNRNNAALYFLAVTAFYSALSHRPVSNVLVYLLIGLPLGALGVMVAVAAALIYAVGKLRYTAHLLLVATLGVALVLLLPEQMLLARLKPVMDSYVALAEGRIDLHTVSYGDLVTQLRTSDLSFIFRLKHWVDLWELFQHGSLYQKLFGFGVGSSVRLSDMHLVPHNDYLRYLFECGLVTFVGFVSLLAISLKEIGRRWEAVPLVAVSFYFFSENLINNYLAMIMFFFSLGATLYRVRLEKRAAARV